MRLAAALRLERAQRWVSESSTATSGVYVTVRTSIGCDKGMLPIRGTVKAKGKGRILAIALLT